MCCINHPRLGPSYESGAEFETRMDEAIGLLLKGIRQMNGSIIRCKMRVGEVLHSKDENGNTTQERVTLQAVYGKEGSVNADWSKWTPSANFTIHINNPAAMGKLSNGHEFYVDFTPATE